MGEKKIKFQSLAAMEQERQAEFLGMSYEERWENLQHLVLMNLANHTDQSENEADRREGIELPKKA